jgi:hypothetical protein
MNWEKITGNFLVAFATAFGAAAVVGGMDAYAVALLNAAIFGALAVGKELLSDENVPKTRRVLSATVMM